MAILFSVSVLHLARSSFVGFARKVVIAMNLSRKLVTEREGSGGRSKLPWQIVLIRRSITAPGVERRKLSLPEESSLPWP
jgi:hypothetical protein